MIVTEEEAKTKRCQESFGPYYTSPDGNRMMAMSVNYGAGYAIQASPSHCIGPACMAWRWRGWATSDDPPDGYWSKTNPIADHPDFKRYGFCGKAGKP